MVSVEDKVNHAFNVKQVKGPRFLSSGPSAAISNSFFFSSSLLLEMRLHPGFNETAGFWDQ